MRRRSNIPNSRLQLCNSNFPVETPLSRQTQNEKFGRTAGENRRNLLLHPRLTNCHRQTQKTRDASFRDRNFLPSPYSSPPISHPPAPQQPTSHNPILPPYF